MEKGLRLIEKCFEYNKANPLEYSSLALAYIGDAVYELVVRSISLLEGNRSVNKMNKDSTVYSKAVTQSRLIHSIEDMLTDDERAVYKRGRNAKSVTMSKHATMIEYRRATGFEALIGYLYISGNEDRILELVKAGIENINQEKV